MASPQEARRATPEEEAAFGIVGAHIMLVVDRHMRECHISYRSGETIEYTRKQGMWWANGIPTSGEDLWQKLYLLYRSGNMAKIIYWRRGGDD